MKLNILKGKELPAKDLSGTSDPYVRVTLLPDKKHRLETKIKRRTLNPRWNETFYFEGFPVQKLQSRILHLHVFDYDRFSRDDSIGEVFLPLCQVDFTGKPSFWKALKPPAKARYTNKKKIKSNQQYIKPFRFRLTTFCFKFKFIT